MSSRRCGRSRFPRALGLPYGELARQLGVTEAVVSFRMRHLRSAIRAQGDRTATG